MGFRPCYVCFVSAAFAILSSLLVFSIAWYKGHITPIFPYLSSCGVFPPEKYVFSMCFTLYGVMTFISHWLWCDVFTVQLIGTKFDSKCGRAIVTASRVLVTIEALGIIGLSVVTMDEDQWVHFGAAIAVPYTALLSFLMTTIVRMIVRSKECLINWARVYVMAQILTGLALFHYYGPLAASIFNGKSFHLRTPADIGYYEFTISAVGEWLIMTGLPAILIVQGIEIRKYVIEDPVIVECEPPSLCCQKKSEDA